MKAIERISEYLNFKIITPHKFEQTVHLSNGYFQKQLRNKGSIGSDILIKVSDKYNDLNILWVLTGEGSMLKFPAKIIELNENQHYNIY
jgi:repressor LexA